MKVTIEQLRTATQRVLAKQGYTNEDATLITNVLLYAQLRGNNQGIVKLIGGGMPNATGTVMEIVKETKVSALIDAHQQQAMVVATRAADIVAKKAKEHGIAVVGVKGANSSSGALGFYARHIAQHDLVGMVFVGIGLGVVAPEGSFEATFGTNPLAVAIPGNDAPVVLDMTTSSMAYYGVMEAKTAGQKLPKGIAFDKAGQATDDPTAVLDGGSLRPFDKSHKSSNLSLIIQLLTGPLVGSGFKNDENVANNWSGHLMVAIDPEVLGGTAGLKAHLAEIVAKVKAARKLPGVEEILVAGERGDRATAEALVSGEVEIEDNLWKGVQEAAKP